MIKIHLTNSGQDLEWIVVDKGRIVDVSPLISKTQRKYWIKRQVINEEFIVDHPVYLGGGSQLKHNIARVEEIE